MYRFRFERLLEVKERLLEHKRSELERTVGEAEALAQAVRAIEGEIAARYDGMSGRLIPEGEFSLILGSLRYLDIKKADVMREKGIKDAAAAALRAELAALLLEMKMLGKLKARALRAAAKSAGRREQKVMDEVAMRAER